MMENKPYLQIIEQPAEKSFRFRYESEGRLSGSILGVKSTTGNPTYPTIKVGNFTGVVTIRISCVTHTDPAVQHPHKLSTKELRKSGIVWIQHNVEQSKEIKIKDIGIVFVKKGHIKESLKLRQNENTDPTRGGFDHMFKPNLIDLHSVRLCFEAFILSKNQSGNKHIPIGYVLSTPIMDKKSNGLLKIVEMSSVASSVLGGEKIILLCDKVKREDISILFYEEDDDRKVIWKEEINYKNSTSMKVHHQYAILFRTPEYREYDIREAGKVFIQLYRPSDNEYSEPIAFEFVPHAQSVQLRRKKQKKVNESQNSYVGPLKKADKSKYVPKIQDENNLMGANRSNAMHRTANPPTLINLDEKKKENNIQVPLNNQMQNTYQAPMQPQYQRQTANPNLYDDQYNCGTYSNSNYPLYYHRTPIAQHQNVNGDLSNAQVSYNQRPVLLTNMYQQQQQQQHQQQQQQPQPNLYTNGQQHGGYVDREMDLTANHPVNPNFMPMTYNIHPNRASDYPAYNNQVMNDEANLTNFSDIEVMKFDGITNEIDNIVMDSIVNSVESIKL